MQVFKNRIIGFVFVCAVIIIIGGGFFLFGSYFQQKVDKQKIDAITKSKELLKTENEKYRGELAEIKMHLSRLKSLEDKLIDIFGLKSSMGPDKTSAKKGGIGGPEISYAADRLMSKELLLGETFFHKDAEKLFLNILRKEEVFSEISDYVKNRNIKLKRPLFVFSIMPASGKVNSSYGTRMDPISDDMAFHEGIDISADYWTPVRAVADGKVTFVGWDSSGYGKMIAIEHERGYSTAYAHNCTTIVKVNESVKKGEVIAYVGNSGRSTGPHLHFEVRYNGRSVNPMNHYFRRG